VTTIDPASGGEAYLSQIPKLGAQDYTYGRDEDSQLHVGRNTVIGHHHHFGKLLGGFSPLLDGGAGCVFNDNNNHGNAAERRQHYQKNAQRSVQLLNLPEGMCYSEIVNSVKGGLLLDIFLRGNDRSVAISFLEEDAARLFFSFVK
jgi:hypothetical protein